MIKIYDPTARAAGVELPVLGAASLEGRRVGLLDNGWPSWQTVLSHYEETELRGARGAGEVSRWQIPLSSAAPADTIEEAAERSDLVIVGLAN
jgi:hypothetical protein